MTGWGADFSYSYLKKLLEVIRSDFQPQLLGNAVRPGRPTDKRPAFLRHDVDVDLGKALRMAEIEHEHGVPATYMIMNASLMYSLRDGSVRRALRELQSLGHEVGPTPRSEDGRAASASSACISALNADHDTDWAPPPQASNQTRRSRPCTRRGRARPHTRC